MEANDGDDRSQDEDDDGKAHTEQIVFTFRLDHVSAGETKMIKEKN